VRAELPASGLRPTPDLEAALEHLRAGFRELDVVATGSWTEHAFRARFRPAALSRPQVKAFREWLISQAGGTRTWLERVAESRGRSTRDVAKKVPQGILKART